MLHHAVLLPGLHGTRALFDGLLACAPDGLAMRALDLPTAGPQDYATLERALEPQLPAGREPWALVAESFSGPLAIRIAARAPGGLGALVLVNSFVASPVGLGLGAVAPFGAPLIRRLGQSPRLIRNRLLGDDAPEALVARVRASLRDLPPDTLAARLRTLAVANETAAYLRTQVPLFYLRGDDDRLVPDSAMDRLIRTRPGLQVHRMAGPHLLLQRHPDAAMASLRHCLSVRG